MRARSGTTALVAGIFAGTIVLAAPAASQTPTPPRDSAYRFSLFGGVAAAQGYAGGAELGASADFRWAAVPVPLRLSLAFSQHSDDYSYYSERGGRASLDLVMRPFPKKLGIRPYFLGGLGVATQAEVSGVRQGIAFGPDGPIYGPAYYFNRPRQTWAFASVGAGLDIGRVFIQLKLDQPVASQGPRVIPLSVGFRFWD